MEFYGRDPRRLETYGKHPGDVLFDFMKMNVKELEVEWREVYIDLISARSSLKGAIKLRGVPVRIGTRGDKLYLIRKDL